MPTPRKATLPTRISIAESRAGKRTEARRDAERAEEQQALSKARAKKLDSVAVRPYGSVIQVTSDGLLIYDRFFQQTILVSDCSQPYVDGDQFLHQKVYPIGAYRYLSTSGAENTVKRYTCNPVVAMKYMIGLQEPSGH